LGYVQTHKNLAQAFNQYWEDKIGPYNSLDDIGMEPYKNNIPNAAHVCVKAPTAGGKTVIAVNALHTFFRFIILQFTNFALPQNRASR
jgi:type III restriction enzyme